MDDLIVRNDLSAFQRFKATLSTYFIMKYSGPRKYFLGVDVACNQKRTYLCQRNYAMDISTNVSLLGAKLLTFPIKQYQSKDFENYL